MFLSQFAVPISVKWYTFQVSSIVYNPNNFIYPMRCNLFRAACCAQYKDSINQRNDPIYSNIRSKKHQGVDMEYK